ncbi:MAG TPA: membrane protein insertase YidC [Planctomycetota bacterium]|nr:membrane protein insertase YidC [Planctomycetota bacterium]
MDKRTLLAIALCMAIFILWTGVIRPKIWPEPPRSQAQARPPAAPGTPAAPPPAAVSKPAEAAPLANRPQFAEEPAFRIQTPQFSAEFTNVGAGLRSLILKYPPGRNDTVDLLLPRESRIPHFAVRQKDGPDAIESIPWKVEERKEGESIKFSFPLRNGLTLTKEFRIDPSTYTFKVTLGLEPPRAEEGKAPQERWVQLELLAFNGLEHESKYRYEQYFKGVALVGEKIRDSYVLGSVAKAEEKVKEVERDPGAPDYATRKRDAEEPFTVQEMPRKWFGLRNRFFTVLLLPDSNTSNMLASYFFHSSSPEAVQRSDGLKNLNAGLLTGGLKVADKQVFLSFSAYAGPIQKEALEQMPDASRLQSYGSGCLVVPAPLTNLVGQVILSLLKIFSNLFHNWGVGIIVTTLLIRVCIFPLSKKSQESAYKMQQLAPKIQALRDRYKDDQQKFGMEQMRLFREHKINPLSGCLPVFLQLPIFIGMFSVFDTSIELRGQPFFGWIKDLSRPDRLFPLPTTIDVFFLPTMDALNLLPILMLITWFLQAYFAPRSPDPQMQQQQKMMMAMPVIFGMMCYNYASGLSLYFLINSGLAMVEQKVIKKYILKIPPGGQGPKAVTDAGAV